MTSPWSEWKLYEGWCPDIASFKETLDGGQAFCWHLAGDNTYEGVVLDIPLQLSWRQNNQVYWSTASAQKDKAEEFLTNYLGTHEEYKTYYDTLPWRSDAHLKACMDSFPELRILRQPQGETLLGFLCSATKQIVQIKEMIQLVRDRFGDELIGQAKQLPTWEDLVEVEESALRECKFGFRAANIHKTAIKLQEEQIDLDRLRSQPYEEAKEALCQLPGVGEKVADCVLLFGYHKLEAFPVDTWILKVMTRHYGLKDWSPKQVAHFGRTHFGSFAGLAQQFLFAWERKNGGR